MTIPERYSFTRYLAAKKSVDDRSLNPHVWKALGEALAAIGGPGMSKPTAGTPLRVLEVGAGIGTMIERMLGWGLLQHAEYTALDAEAVNIDAARDWLPEWAAAHGYQARHEPEGRIILERAGACLKVDLEAIDLFDFIAREKGERQWDLLVAHAFLDLMDIPATLPQLFSLLEPGGLFYFTLNFDGLTALEPAIDPPFDELIQILYHRTMDERITGGKPSGDSRAGRHLIAHLRDAGARILSAGASDWVVFADPERHPGGYHQDEAYFLHFIVHTIDQALKDHPEIDPQRFERWVAARHAQVERGELTYIAHQLDFLGRLEVKYSHTH